MEEERAAMRNREISQVHVKYLCVLDLHSPCVCVHVCRCLEETVMKKSYLQLGYQLDR